MDHSIAHTDFLKAPLEINQFMDMPFKPLETSGHYPPWYGADHPFSLLSETIGIKCPGRENSTF